MSMYHELPMLTASLASRLPDKQDATFLVVWYLSLDFCSFLYIEIGIRNFLNCMIVFTNVQTARKERLLFFGH